MPTNDRTRIIYRMTPESAAMVASVKRAMALTHFQVVDVAVQGLLQTEDELRHTQNLQPRFFRIA